MKGLEKILDIGFYLGLEKEIRFYMNCLIIDNFDKIQDVQVYDFETAYLVILHCFVVLTFGDYGTSPLCGFIQRKTEIKLVDYINKYLRM